MLLCTLRMFLSGFAKYSTIQTADLQCRNLSRNTQQDSRLPELTSEILTVLEKHRRSPNAAFYQALEEAVKNCSLTVVDLKDLRDEESLKVVVDSFLAKSPFNADCEHPNHREDQLLQTELEALWPCYRAVPTSIGLVDKTGRLVAVSGMADVFQAPRPYLDEESNQKRKSYTQEMGVYLNKLESKVSHLLPKVDRPGVMLSRSMVGIVPGEFSSAKNFYLLFAIAREQHKRTKDHGYQYSVRRSIHAYTQEIARYFGCKDLLIDYPKEYVNDSGVKPFACLSKDTRVTFNLKKHRL